MTTYQAVMSLASHVFPVPVVNPRCFFSVRPLIKIQLWGRLMRQKEGHMNNERPECVSNTSTHPEPG